MKEKILKPIIYFLADHETEVVPIITLTIMGLSIWGIIELGIWIIAKLIIFIYI